MAEINIEPKKRSTGWSWIIVLLILALVGWLLYKYLFEANPENAETIETPTTGWVMPEARPILTT